MSVVSKKDVVLIPFWIQDVLKRNNLPLSTCLELDKIRPIFSMGDLISFLGLQSSAYTKLITGMELLDSLYWEWSNSVIKSNTELLDLLQNTINVVSHDESVQSELYHRLFDIDSKDRQYDKPFAIFDLTPNVCGVVIYPGYFIDNNIELQLHVIEGIIEIFYRYMSFHETASTIYFKRYLELLSLKNK